MIRAVIVLLCLLLLAPSAPAWNRAGHEQVARIAWSRLDVATRARVLTILKAHPAWAQWRQDVGDDDERLFARASTWADEIRKDPTMVAPEEVHADWHYIDVPITFDGTPLRPAPRPNVLTALRDNQHIVADPSASARDRAIALAWLIHLMGDVHQPLHCAERFSADLPNGDLGGNRWSVREAQGPPINLHAFWDGLITSKTAATSVTASQISFEALVEEGVKLARHTAYQDGHVAGVAAADPHHLPTPPLALDPAYVERARVTARQQVGLAGVRLAAVLSKALGP